MKKMITALASIATGILFGAANGAELTTATGTSFEALTQRPVTVGDIVKADDTGDTEGVRYWYSTADETEELGAITNDVASGLSRPDMFLNETQSKSLFIETSNDHPLVRTALTNTGASSVTGVDIGDGIYLDTLVKFTAAEDEFKSDLEGGDKIAIEYVAREAEYTNGVDQVTGEPTNLVAVAAMTNFVVRAGLIGEELGQANYYAYVSGDPEFANFDKDAWHRLTVRTIADVGDGHVGFVIYLDGDMTKTLEYPTNVDAGFGTLNPLAQTFYNENKHALFPSAVEALATGGSTISSVAFSGNGFIDDVSFTATKPTFINEAVLVTIAWDEHVTGMTINDTVLTAEQVAALSWTGEPDNGSVVAVATFESGYVAGVPVIPEGATYDPVTETFGNLTAGMTCTIKSMFPYFEVNGQRFDKFADAVAVATGASAAQRGTVKVYASYTGDIEVKTGFVTIDLAGQTLTGKTDAAIINDGADLIITNSTVTIGHIEKGAATQAILLTGGSTTITAGWVDGEVYVDGGALTLTGGYYYDVYENTSVDNFYLAVGGATITDTVSYVGDPAYYFQVGTSAPPPIGTYTVTVTPNANADYAAAYKVGGETITPANDVLTVTVGQTIVITATPAANYEYAEVPTGWTAGQDGEITIEVSAEATVAIPAPTAVVIGTYSVTVIPTNNTTYAAAYNDGGAAVEFVNDVAAVTVGKTITITVTPASGYAYAETPTGWTAGQDGKITIEVSAEATVAIPGPTATGSYPSYISGITDPAVKAEYEDLYDDWATAYTVADGSGYEAAFLLNIAPNAEDQTLKEASITISGTTVTITANQYLNKVNGKVYIKTAGTLAGLESASWSVATLDESGAVTMTSNGTAAFFKIKVDF